MAAFSTWKIIRHGGENFIHGSQWCKLTTGNQNNRFKVVHIHPSEYYILPHSNGRRKIGNYRNNVVLEHPDQNIILYQRKSHCFLCQIDILKEQTNEVIYSLSNSPSYSLELQMQWAGSAHTHGTNERQQKTRRKWKQLERVPLGPDHLLCIMYQLNCALLPTG